MGSALKAPGRMRIDGEPRMGYVLSNRQDVGGQDQRDRLRSTWMAAATSHESRMSIRLTELVPGLLQGLRGVKNQGGVWHRQG
jgi:hypothetical protein